MVPALELAGVVRPPTEDPLLEDPSTWAQQLDNQQARLETVFKFQLVKGNLPAAEDDPAWYFQQDLEIQLRSFAVAADSGDGWSILRRFVSMGLRTTPAFWVCGHALGTPVQLRK
jgi:hypothetical protein